MDRGKILNWTPTETQLFEEPLAFWRFPWNHFEMGSECNRILTFHQTARWAPHQYFFKDFSHF